MENCITHNTHNLSYTSSEAQYGKNNKTSSSSSEGEFIEGNKPQNEWSKLIKQNSSKEISIGILNEDEINITNKSYEDKTINVNNKSKENKNQKIKNKGTKKKKNKNRKKRYNLDGKFILLENGILVKNLNKEKMMFRHPWQKNQFLIPKEKTITTSRQLNNNNPFLPKFRKNKEDSFQVMYIKRPQRSFITKICKYKKIKPKKIKEIKKFSQSSSAHNSFGIFNKKPPNSSRINQIPTSIIQNNENGRLKSLIRNKDSNINDNSENKFASLSTTSIKKATLNSNASLCFSKSNNKFYNHIKNRPPSSNEREEKNCINLKNSKIDNFDITIYNKSYNNIKTRPISSMMNSRINQSDKSIYDNVNFIKEFKELKNAFETCDNINNDKTLNNFNIYIHYYSTLKKNPNRDINKVRKFSSASCRNSSYQQYNHNEMPPFINLENKNNFEEEKDIKHNKRCNNIVYQKHFGNDKTCPICVSKKEQNHLREEKLNNRNYYFPFKDKYDTNYSFQSSFRNQNNDFNNCKTEKRFKIDNNYINLFNSKKGNVRNFLNPFYLNSIFNSSHNVGKRIMRNKIRCKDIKRNKSNINEKYDFLQKYFE